MHQELKSRHCNQDEGIWAQIPYYWLQFRDFSRDRSVVDTPNIEDEYHKYVHELVAGCLTTPYFPCGADKFDDAAIFHGGSVLLRTF